MESHFVAQGLDAQYIKLFPGFQTRDIKKSLKIRARF
jgi:hypothetical protein